MGIYKNIQNVCREKGMTINGLEAQLGFGRGSIYKWDSHTPSVAKMKDVADVLGVTVDDLIKACEETNETEV